MASNGRPAAHIPVKFNLTREQYESIAHFKRQLDVRRATATTMERVLGMVMAKGIEAIDQARSHVVPVLDEELES